MRQINAQNSKNLALYEAQYLSIFTHIDYLQKMCFQNHVETFKYRIREDESVGDYIDLSLSEEERDTTLVYPNLPKSLR